MVPKAPYTIAHPFTPIHTLMVAAAVQGAKLPIRINQGFSIAQGHFYTIPGEVMIDPVTLRLPDGHSYHRDMPPPITGIEV